MVKVMGSRNVIFMLGGNRPKALERVMVRLESDQVVVIVGFVMGEDNAERMKKESISSMERCLVDKTVDICMML
jgi:hypothetical protein